MSKELSTWNNYLIKGDVTELDHIIETDGLINIDKDDIINTLSDNGENYVAVGINSNMNDAICDALKVMPCSIEKISNILIDFRCGSMNFNMAELSNLSGTLSKSNRDITIKWGISLDKSLGESNKVILVASI